MKVADKRILYLIIDALFNQQQEKKYLIELDCIKDFLSFLSGLKDKTSYPIETAVCLE